MEITLHPDADAAYISIQPSERHHTHEVNDATFVDLDSDSNPLSIRFLYVSNGVDQQEIPGLNDHDNREVFTLLRDSGVKAHRVSEPARADCTSAHQRAPRNIDRPPGYR